MAANQPTRHGPRFKDMVGMVFGRLTVLSLASCLHGRTYWLCRCQCGNEKTVAGSNLRRGDIRSCGCFRKEDAVRRSTKHGKHRWPEYRIWKSIKDRCKNQQNVHYKNYGGRGITICPEWDRSFEAFIQEVGRRPRPSMTIDRIENDRGYEPGNVRWASRLENANNKRNNLRLTCFGVTLTITQWSMRIGLGQKTLRNRLRLGWSAEEALHTPLGCKRQSPGGSSRS